MQYKTIVHELIQNMPELHERLRSSNTLLSMTNQLAAELQAYHQTNIDQLRLKFPQTPEIQLKSQALEIAIMHLQLDLNSEADSDTQ